MRVSLFALYAELDKTPSIASAVCFGQCDGHECPSCGNPLFLSGSLSGMTHAATRIFKRQRPNMRTRDYVLCSIVCALDFCAQLIQFPLEHMVTSIEMIHAADFGMTFRRQGREHQRGTGTQVGCHDRGRR